MAETYPRCLPGGDRHLYLELGDRISPEVNNWVHRVRLLLQANAIPGLVETTPAYASLLMRFDPRLTDHKVLAGICLAAAEVAISTGASAEGSEEAGPEPVAVPVVYGGDEGPDLDEVARWTGLDSEEVVRRHIAGRYRVYMAGFAPGFAYLGGMDESLATPRRREPRVRVPAGSVGIAGRQTGIYPANLPGGWMIVGRTPLGLWRPDQAEPALLPPGRRVRFVRAGDWPQALAMAGTGWEHGEGAVTGRALSEPGRPVAKVRRPGPLDTVQDAGRWGYSGLGLPESGPLDWPALRDVNRRLGNEARAAALEMTYSGPVLEFQAPIRLTLSPGGRGRLGGRDILGGTVFEARAGDVLELGPFSTARAYLAFSGGLALTEVLGSRATYLPARLGGMEGRPLKAGDVLQASGGRRAWGGDGRGPGVEPGAGAPRPPQPAERAPGTPGQAPQTPRRAPQTMTRAWEEWGGPDREPGAGRVVAVRVVLGPQKNLFTREAVESFLAQAWRILESSDRRACLLGGTPLTAPSAGGLSDGTPAGSIQVPPSGAPVVLLADHQTTGGYPKIGVVVTPDLPLLGRTWPGDYVRFEPLAVEDAVSLWRGGSGIEPGDWPGGMEGESGPAAEAGRAARVFRLMARGRSHLVTVRSSAPRED